MTLHDAQRDKDLTVRIRYPVITEDHPGPFPLVVFSHGAGGSCDAFASLSAFLVSNGYIVVHPTHSDSLTLVPREQRGERTRDLIRNPRGIVEKVDLRDRVADVKYILDSVDAIEEEIDQPGLIDREKFAMAGHSAGAMTTQVLGGMEFVLGRRTLKSNLVEPRF